MPYTNTVEIPKGNFFQNSTSVQNWFKEEEEYYLKSRGYEWETSSLDGAGNRRLYYFKQIQSEKGRIENYNTPMQATRVLYKLDNRIVDLYTVLQILGFFIHFFTHKSFWEKKTNTSI